MLPRKNRLPVGEFFTLSSKTFSTKALLVKFRPNTLPFSRIAVILKKSVVPGATKRHLIKRRVLGELVRYFQAQTPGFDVCIIGISGIEKATKQQLFDQLHQVSIVVFNQ